MHSRLFLLFVSCLLLTACSNNPQEAVQNYIQSYNDGDLEAFAATLAPNVVLSLEGIWEIQGSEAARNFADYNSTLNSRLDARELVGDGGLVRCLAIERNDWLALAGVDSITEILCFEVEDGAITMVHIVLTGPSQNRLDDAFEEVVAWAEINQPEMLAEVMPQGTMIFTRETAEIWRSLWNDFRQVR